jgi:hypothetical protein
MGESYYIMWNNYSESMTHIFYNKCEAYYSMWNNYSESMTHN